MKRITKAIRIIRDHFRSMPFLEFLTFMANVPFKNDLVRIYCVLLPRGAVCEETGAGIAVAKGELAELVSYRERLARPPWELQCDLYDGVQDFFVYKHEDGIGHITWLYYAADPNRLLRLGAEECEAKFVLTFPEHRGRGIFPAALRAIQVYLQAKGCRRLFVCVKDGNIASIRAIEKAGFHQVGTTRFRKILGVQTSRRTDTRSLIADEGFEQ